MDLNFYKKNIFKILVAIAFIFIIGLAIHNKLNAVEGYYSLENDIALEPRVLNFDLPAQIKRSTISGPSRGESECKRVMEKIYGRTFEKTRPQFLTNPITGRCLELDCYNHELRIACEYNGQQHYQFNAHFHNNQAEFLNQKYRDDIKQRLCKEHGIKLIIVPNTCPIDKIEQYIRQQL